MKDPEANVEELIRVSRSLGGGDNLKSQYTLYIADIDNNLEKLQEEFDTVEWRFIRQINKQLKAIGFEVKPNSNYKPEPVDKI